MDDLLRLAQDPDAWAALATLIAMEVVLGLDNLVFIALLTNRIDERRRGLARKLGLSSEIMRETVRIGEAVKAASAKNILDLADRMLAPGEPKAASTSCCGGSAKAAAPETKAKSCC